MHDPFFKDDGPTLKRKAVLVILSEQANQRREKNPDYQPPLYQITCQVSPELARLQQEVARAQRRLDDYVLGQVGDAKRSK